MAASLLLCAAFSLSPHQDATLTVTVVDGTTELPLKGPLVSLKKLQPSNGASVRWESRGPLGSALTCDTEGQVVFEIDSTGKPLRLSAFGQDGTFLITSVMVPALGAGEDRALTVKLERAEKRPYHLRLVDSESGKPIVGAKLFATVGITSAGPGMDPWLGAKDWEPRGKPLATSDSDGRLALEWTRSYLEWADVFAAGYGALSIPVEGTHSDPKQPRVIRVSPAAAVVGHCWDEDGLGVEGLTVGVLARPWHMSRPGSRGGLGIGPNILWSTPTDAAGRFELESLPAGITLTFAVRRGSQVLEEVAISLQPEESRDLSNSIRPLSDLRGTLVDEAGDPIPSVEVQLSAATPERPGFSGYLARTREHVRTTTTDPNGRFVFPSVPLGQWLVGPKPKRPSARQATKWTASWAPYARRLRLPVEHEVKLTGYRGTITGNVRDPQGNPLGGVGLVAEPSDGFGSVTVKTAADGSFKLGPLGPGPHRLRPMGLPFEWFCDGMSGTPGNNIEFVARPAAAVRGHAVDDDSGEQRRARFALMGEDGTWTPRSFAQRRTSFAGLAPGTYSLIATTEDGRFGMRAGIEVRGGETSAEQVVRLKPGGRIRLMAPATDSRSYVVQVGEFWVALFNNGDYREVVVPAGRVTVSLLKEGRPFPGSERRLEITVGATTVFEPE
jgi:hypothetical protein